MHKSKSWPTIANEVVIYEDDIQHSGSLRKQSLVWKMWRKRWCVLTSQYLSSFKYEGDYRIATETIALTDCLSVRSVDNETGQENSFCVVTKDRTFCLIASSTKEKEGWTAAIMNSVLPMLSSRGLRRSLSLFAIVEEDQEDDDDAWTWVPSPKKLFKSLMTPKSGKRSTTKSSVPSSLNGGDTANATTHARLDDVPSLDAVPTQCIIVERRSLGDTSLDAVTTRSTIARRRGLDNGDMLVGSNRPPSIGSCDEDFNSNDDRADAKPLTTSRRFALDESLLEVEDDRMIVSPKVLRSLRLSDDCFVEFEDDRIVISPKKRPSLSLRTMAPGSKLVEVVDKHAKEAGTVGIDEATEAWVQEQFQVGEMVLARDYEVQAWVHGVVSSVDPLKVQPEGKSKGYSFKYVCSANGMKDSCDVTDQSMNLSDASKYDECARSVYKHDSMLDIFLY